jgi:hypothetical protein
MRGELEKGGLDRLFCFCSDTEIAAARIRGILCAANLLSLPLGIRHVVGSA